MNTIRRIGHRKERSQQPPCPSVSSPEPAPSGFRFFNTFRSKVFSYVILINDAHTRYMPVIMLSAHQDLLESLLDGRTSVQDCGIMTIMLHSWQAFGIEPLGLVFDIKSVPGEKPRAIARLSLRQANELGKNIGVLEISPPDAVLLSIIFALAVQPGPKYAIMTAAIENPQQTDEQIFAKIRNDITFVETSQGYAEIYDN